MRKQWWVFPLFSPDSNDRLSLNFHRLVIFYRSCDTQSVGLRQYCLPKVSNGFNASSHFVQSRKYKTSMYKWILALTPTNIQICWHQLSSLNKNLIIASKRIHVCICKVPLNNKFPAQQENKCKWRHKNRQSNVGFTKHIKLHSLHTELNVNAL